MKAPLRMNNQGRVKSGSMTTSSSDAKALATSRSQRLPMAWNMLGPSPGGMRPDAVWRDVLDFLATVDGAVDDGPMKADAPPRGAARSARMDESFILNRGAWSGWAVWCCTPGWISVVDSGRIFLRELHVMARQYYLMSSKTLKGGKAGFRFL